MNVPATYLRPGVTAMLIAQSRRHRAEALARRKAAAEFARHGWDDKASAELAHIHTSHLRLVK
jgi:hypothetical protein